MDSTNITAAPCGSAPAADAPELRFLKQVAGLVSPPEVYARACELVESPDSSADDVAAVISCDPNLTMRLLGLVNSSYFNLAQSVDTVSRAITVVGMRDLYNLVIAVTAVRTFSKIPNSLVSMDTFWRHSIYVGLLARALARRCHVLHPERMFVAGLLHDIGSLVLYHEAPEACAEQLLIAAGDEELLFQSEWEGFGFTHADLGRHMAEDWHLPPALCRAIGCHHRPDTAQTARQEASLIYLANRLANGFAEGNFCGQQVEDDSGCDALLTAVELTPEAMEAALEEVAEQFPAAASALVG